MKILLTFGLGFPFLPLRTLAGEPCGEASVGIECVNGSKCVQGPASSEAFKIAGDSFHEIHQTEHGFHCECSPEWTGVDCSVPVESCADGTHYCLNGGECVENEGTGEIYCDCSRAQDEKGRVYDGKFCEHTETTFCNDDESVFCFNGGECNESYPDSGEVCFCPHGFDGPHCEYRGDKQSSGNDYLGIPLAWWIAIAVVLTTSLVVFLYVVCCRISKGDSGYRRRLMRRSTYKQTNKSQRLDWDPNKYYDNSADQANLAALHENEEPPKKRMSFTERALNFTVTRQLPFRVRSKGKMPSNDDSTSATREDEHGNEDPPTSSPGFLTRWFKASNTKGSENNEEDAKQTAELVNGNFSSSNNSDFPVAAPVVPDTNETYATAVFGPPSPGGSDGSGSDDGKKAKKKVVASDEKKGKSNEGEVVDVDI